MPLAAPAAGTATRAAANTVAAASAMRLRNDRLPARRAQAQRALEAVIELDLRLPAEDLARAGDVGLALLGVVLGQRLVHDLARGAGDPEDRLREVEDRELARIAEVDRQVLAARREQEQPANEVVDVAEASCLRAVAEDGERLARECLAKEGRDRAPVVGAHARPVGVEDPDDRRVDALLAV